MNKTYLIPSAILRQEYLMSFQQNKHFIDIQVPFSHSGNGQTGANSNMKSQGYQFAKCKATYE